jgi:hypothetical protein
MVRKLNMTTHTQTPPKTTAILLLSSITYYLMTEIKIKILLARKKKKGIETEIADLSRAPKERRLEIRAWRENTVRLRAPASSTGHVCQTARYDMD